MVFEYTDNQKIKLKALLNDKNCGIMLIESVKVRILKAFCFCLLVLFEDLRAAIAIKLLIDF